MANFVGRQVGNYKIVRLLGTGGFAEVYLGEHVYLKSQAAIKILSVQVGLQGKESFLAEARTLVGLKHPHIVQVFDFGMERNTPFLVMEYAPSGSLHQRHPKGTRLSTATVVAYVKQVTSALQFAHDRRLIHRDVKPENMLVGDSGNVLLADFGIATIAQSTYQSNNGMTGTITYMAPEQIEGRPTMASDQYALGVVAYEWLSGSAPFQGSFMEICAQHIYAKPPPLREKVPGLAAAIDHVVQTALAKEPEQRFGSVQKFAEALEQACQAAEVHERPATYYDTYPMDQTNQNAGQYNAHPPSPVRHYAPLPRKQEAEDLYGVVPPPPGNTFYAPVRESTPHASVPVQAPPRKKSRTGCVIASAAVAVLLLVVGGVVLHSGALSYLASYVVPSVRAVPPSTVMTPAAHASPGSTVTPLAAQTPQELYTSATSGNPAVNDTLTGPDPNGWDNNGNTCFYAGAAYHAKISQPGVVGLCNAGPGEWQDFAFQVTMKFSTGTQSDGGGLIIRNTGSEENRLRVSIDGSYDFVGQNGVLLSGTSPAIQTGPGQTNVVTVVVRGRQVYIYINNQYIASSDQVSAPSGRIGVFAVSFTAPTDIIYRQARVWRL